MPTQIDDESLTILIVEDNDLSLNIAQTILSSDNANHVIRTAKTVQEGIDKYKQCNPDVVFLDLALPDGSGFRVLETIKMFDDDAYVILVTASRIKDDMLQAYEKGAKGYVMKPFSAKRMKECIEKYYLDQAGHVKL